MKKLKVFYDERQNAPVRVSSPSATKPKELVTRWTQQNRPIEVCGFSPLERNDFYLAHDVDHVEEILNGKKPSALHTTDLRIAATFPWTSGSLYAAALASLTEKTFTCSPTSGFHHANFSTAQGFCTFNGLIIAARKLLATGVKKIGILDCDCHYGNGTDDLIEKFKLQSSVQHYTFGFEDNMKPYWDGDERAEAWLARFPAIVESFADCEIVLYQAGADPHVDDPLGGALTSEQIRERDRIVFQTLKNLKVPAVWNLAGGYQHPMEKVLALHDATLEECIKHL